MTLIDKDKFENLYIQYLNVFDDESMAINKALENIPVVKEIFTKHAHWFDRDSLFCRCSNCGCKNLEKSEYCPHCFAVMDEGE